MTEVVKGTTGSRGKKHELDKFYTKLEIAEWCLSTIKDLNHFDTIIEHSAGSGVFLDVIENIGYKGRIEAFDLHPEDDRIKESDWLLFSQEKEISSDKALIVGNPPFGRSGSLAMRFIKASIFADRIAFILPRGFKKQSVKNRIPEYFHLLYEEDLPSNSFILNGEDYSINCVWQVWEKENTLRKIPPSTLTSDHIAFTDKQSADFRIQRVGGNAGKASLNLDYSASSNYFIKNNSSLDNRDLIQLINSLDFPTRNDPTGPRSLSKSELLKELNIAMEELKMARSANME